MIEALSVFSRKGYLRSDVNERVNKRVPAPSRQMSDLWPLARLGVAFESRL